MSIVALTVPLELADGGTAYTGAATDLGTLFTVNTTGYNSISIQLTNTWVGTVTFSTSNDGVNWVSIGTATSNGVYIYPTTGIYFMAEVTAYTSGEVDAIAFLRFQQVADINVNADLTQLDANTLATANNTATANTYLSSIATNINESSVPINAVATANGTLFSVDTLGYQTISVQLAGDWQAQCVFQVSNDNSTFANVQGYTFNNYMNSINTAQDNGVYIFPVTGRYFQVVVSNYKAGSISCTAYLRNQSLAGIGETMLTQAMDQANNTPINVTYQNLGQQTAANSVPVAIATEQIQDKFIVGKVFTTTVPISTILNIDSSTTTLNGWIDCTQYSSAYISIAQSGSVTSGVVAIEVSNDGVNTFNTPVGFYDTQNVSAGNTSSAGTTVSLGTTTGATAVTRVGNIGWRYLRLRVSTTINASSPTTIQAFITLRKTTLPYVFATQTNLTALNGSTLPTIGNNLASSSFTTGILTVGSTDNSIVNPQIQGAPYPITNTSIPYGVGPYWRRGYIDFAGNQGVSGPDPRYAEDKTYPVNVRLERTTSGQDSVQDLLLQILVELKAMNHYTRETPQAIAVALSTGNPSNISMSSMADDPENFFDDATTFKLNKGH